MFRPPPTPAAKLSVRVQCLDLRPLLHTANLSVRVQCSGLKLSIRMKCLGLCLHLLLRYLVDHADGIYYKVRRDKRLAYVLGISLPMWRFRTQWASQENGSHDRKILFSFLHHKKIWSNKLGKLAVHFEQMFFCWSKLYQINQTLLFYTIIYENVDIIYFDPQIIEVILVR